MPAYVMGPFTLTASRTYIRNIQSLHISTIKMADKDIATRAPESDAQEDTPAAQTDAERSVFPGDSRAQDGPSMGVRVSY